MPPPQTVKKALSNNNRARRRVRRAREDAAAGNPIFLECVSSGTIRRPKWILRQFKEETRRLSSAKSSLVAQKWRSGA